MLFDKGRIAISNKILRNISDQHVIILKGNLWMFTFSLQFNQTDWFNQFLPIGV